MASLLSYSLTLPFVMDIYKSQSCPLWEQLDSQGYHIVENAVSPSVCQQLRNGILRTLKKSGWRHRSTGKWTVPRNIHGIFQDYNVGYMPEIWEARKLCKHVFSSLWGTDELLCSFDGISFLPKGHVWQSTTDKWYHIDQGFGRQGLQCIQGLLTLNDMDDSDATFSVMPSTHHLHAEFSKTYGAVFSPDENFVRIGRSWNAQDPVFGNMWDFYAGRGHEPIRIAATAGSLVLWDSRCVHSNLPPIVSPGKNERLVVYVCMLPKAGCPAEDLLKRTALFQGKCMTSHWPYPPEAFAQPCAKKGGDKVLPINFDKLIADGEVCALVGL